MGQKQVNMKKKFIEDEIDIIFKANQYIIINGIFNCHTSVQVESCIGFAKYLNYVGITRQNYQIFVKLLETNNKWVVDSLIGIREPKLLFSTIKPNFYLINKAFNMLSFWHPRQIYNKVLKALLGIIEYSYYKSDDGYKIYKLRINDLNNLGKYLDESKPQEEPDNRIILNVLDKMTQLGEYEGDIKKSIIAKHAFNIRIAYFDNRKKLLDVIPQLLLVEMNRALYEVKPPEEYLKRISV